MRTSFVSLAQPRGFAMLAGLVAGVVHRPDDAYGSPATPAVGPLLIRPTIVPRRDPRFRPRRSGRPSALPHRHAAPRPA